MGRRRLPHGDPPDGQVLRPALRRGADHQLRQRLAGSGVVPDPGQGGAGPVSRRVRVPASDELFRPTVVPDDATLETVPAQAESYDAPQPPAEEKAEGRTASGRVRHDEKMTVY